MRRGAPHFAFSTSLASAAAISLLTVLTGIRESANYLRHAPHPSHPAPHAGNNLTHDPTLQPTWPVEANRYQTLKPVTQTRQSAGQVSEVG